MKGEVGGTYKCKNDKGIFSAASLSTQLPFPDHGLILLRYIHQGKLSRSYWTENLLVRQIQYYPCRLLQ